MGKLWFKEAVVKVQNLNLIQKVLTPLCREQLEPSCYLMIWISSKCVCWDFVLVVRSM